VWEAGLFTNFLHFDEANLGFEPSAPVRQLCTAANAGLNLFPHAGFISSLHTKTTKDIAE
jgi:hypothetical protein